MLALAIVVLALVIFLVVVSFVGSSQEVVIDFANVTITASVGEVFVAGVVAGLVALASLVALRISVRGLWNRRKEVRELRRQVGVTAQPGTSERTGGEVRPATGTDRRTESAASAQPTKEQPAERTAEEETGQTTEEQAKDTETGMSPRQDQEAERDERKRLPDEPRS